MNVRLGSLVIAAVIAASCGSPATPPPAQTTTPAPAAAAGDPHGWLGTETIKTRFGDFEFKGGYPTPATATSLHDQLTFNRAIEVYLTQLPAVAIIEQRRGVETFGATSAQHAIIWERLMDAKSLLLTANTETVYGIGFLYLAADGPTVVEAPPHMLGLAMDALQRYLVDIGPLGPDKGNGGKYLFLPPGYTGPVPSGYFVVKSPTYSVTYGVRGFQVDGKTEPAVALMKQLKVYPLAKASSPPAMTFLDGSGKAIDTIHADNFSFFEALAKLVEEEPADVFTPSERFYMRAIGIEKGTPFAPDPQRKALLSDAARVAAAMARANSFGSKDARLRYYDDRQWMYVGDVPFNNLKDGLLEIDRRAYLYYMALGNSPAMMEKNVGAGSYYLWAYNDASGQPFDGAKSYRLHVPPNPPMKQFWSVVVYDALSRSELQNGQPFPSVSSLSGVKTNADGSVDIYFGPTMPAGQEKNWIQTVPGKGFFPMFRFYGPQPALYDKTWKLSDVEEMK
jgi:hypothetical protein